MIATLMRPSLTLDCEEEEGGPHFVYDVLEDQESTLSSCSIWHQEAEMLRNGDATEAGSQLHW